MSLTIQASVRFGRFDFCEKGGERLFSPSKKQVKTAKKTAKAEKSTKKNKAKALEASESTQKPRVGTHQDTFQPTGQTPAPYSSSSSRSVRGAWWGSEHWGSVGQRLSYESRLIMRHYPHLFRKHPR